MLHNSPSALELTPGILFVLFVCPLSSHSLDCISCSGKEMCDAPIGTTSWSPAVKKWNGSKRLTYRGAEGVTSHRSGSVWTLGVTQRSRDFQKWSLTAACNSLSYPLIFWVWSFQNDRCDWFIDWLNLTAYKSGKRYLTLRRFFFSFLCPLSLFFRLSYMIPRILNINSLKTYVLEAWMGP